MVSPVPSICPYREISVVAGACHCLSLLVRSTHARGGTLLILAVVLGLALHVRPLTTARASHVGPIIFVDDSAHGLNDGSTWANGFTSLQAALDHAEGGEQIWVAAGVYTPTALTIPLDPRSATFQLTEGIGIYGGFAGTERTRTERDWRMNRTILSGEIGAAGTGDNSYHVVTRSSDTASTILDGVIITAGNANGILPDAQAGGGMYNQGAGLKLANVSFHANNATLGAGLYNRNSNPVLVSVTFSSNTAESGGGMYNDTSNPQLRNTLFSGNAAATVGGGVSNLASDVVMVNATFHGNSATISGGGIHNAGNSTATVRNSILWGNSGGQIANDTTSSSTALYSLVEGGSPGAGNIDADPRFVDSDGADDVPGTADDNLRLRTPSPAVDAGNNRLVPADTLDLDGDANTSERLPLDRSGAPRFVDVSGRPDAGRGTPPIVDMGAFEVGPAIYVDDSAGGLNDGSVWVNAYTSLQAALDHAEGGEQIWVAAGIYTPTNRANPDDPQSATFQLENGVGIYGGFAGTETSAGQRDWKANLTILSGDIGQDDLTDSRGILTDTTKVRGFPNSDHVVTASGVTLTAVLDGVVVTAGYGVGEDPREQLGGGLHAVNGSPTLVNVTFEGNHTGFYGGGMWTGFGGSPSLVNVTFVRNHAGIHGGGMVNGGGSPTLKHVTFRGNRAEYSGGGMATGGGRPVLEDVLFFGNSAHTGGGMYTEESDALLTRVTFRANDASYAGGGMATMTSSPLLRDVTFWANEVDSIGGGMYNDNLYGGTPVVRGVTFRGNHAGSGGGMYNRSSSPILSSVTFRANTGYNGGGMTNYWRSAPRLANVSFSGNTAISAGGGMYNDRADPSLVTVTFNANVAEKGGGIYNDESSPLVTGVTFRRNRAIDGGAMYNFYDWFDRTATSPRLSNVRFDGNVADNSGGAMYNQTAAPELANVIFSGNDARSGGGIENHSSNSSLVNVAFTGNSARDRGGAISNHDDSGALLANVTFSGNSANVGGAIYNDAESILAVRNSILWGNSGGQIRSNATMSTTVEYSLVAGNRIYPGTGNISGDPQFVDPDGADNTPGTADDDLRLRTSSPAIDAGNNHLVPPDTLDLDGDANASERLPLDLARRARFLDVPARPDSGGGTAPIVDMGAYETKGEAATPMPSQTPTATPTATEPATATVTASATATSPIEATATSTATWTAVATRTSTASSIATPTATATSATPITVPTATRMATATTGPDPDDPSQLFLPLVRR